MNDIQPVFVNFNHSQDCSSLTIGTKTGYKLYVLNNSYELDLIHEDYSSQHICIVERLFCSNLLAFVSLSNRHKLKVFHLKKKRFECNYCYKNTILAVKLNRQRLVVCCEECIYIHNIIDMNLLHSIQSTHPNHNGLCTLSPNSENCYFAYPANNTIGVVNIFDAQNLQMKTSITAHDNPLAAIAFDANGEKMATACEKETVIRVFDVSKGQCIYEFFRGYFYEFLPICVTIHSLSFSADSLFLCASSNTETVHIFKLEKTEEEPQRLFAYLSDCIRKAVSYCPPVADMMNQRCTFATATLPMSGSRNVCSVANIQNVPIVMIASADGYLYLYDLNINEGGECALIKQYILDKNINTGGETSNAVNI